MNEKMMRVMVTNQEKFQKYMKEQSKKKGVRDDEVCDLDLDALVLEVDTELIEEGYQPFQRPKCLLKDSRSYWFRFYHRGGEGRLC